MTKFILQNHVLALVSVHVPKNAPVWNSIKKTAFALRNITPSNEAVVYYREVFEMANMTVIPAKLRQALHATVVAREYGIPAVVGFRRLQNN
ncbi:hypothetical protein SBF1_840034 [Candidatus Desulfosporosinus infrequens]|uniref:PEP-utilising enzyme mobile domain-containing protein n=1 Tax=Candidatus Desulfosporosinus infrequens TaxID=2043169 RepID=A0A2U3LUE9_9FIRM|nr:hypothetical protein SBF1_840034 [Candidatus Desulfosporosinus infrequens]